MKKLVFVFVSVFSFTLAGCSGQDDNVTRFNNEGSSESNSEEKIQIAQEPQSSPEQSVDVSNLSKEAEEKPKEIIPPVPVKALEVNDAQPVLVEEANLKDEKQSPEEVITNGPGIEETKQENKVQVIEPEKPASVIEKPENGKDKIDEHNLPNVGGNLWVSILITLMITGSYLSWRKLKYR